MDQAHRSDLSSDLLEDFRPAPAKQLQRSKHFAAYKIDAQPGGKLYWPQLNRPLSIASNHRFH